MTTTLEKSVPNQNLTLRYKFYWVTSSSNSEYIYIENHDVETTSTETTVITTKNFGNLSMQTSAIRVELEVLDSTGNILTTYFIDNGTGWDITFEIMCFPAGTLILVEVEEEDENGKKRKVRKKKKIEDITYDDDLVVWDFDNRCFTTAKALWIMKKQEIDEYNVLKFSDGNELKTVRQHRIFNKEQGKFTYPMTDETPVGTTTFNSEGEEVKLVSKEVVEGRVEYYNIISNYHMNIFAEGILTSCRLSNLYKIEDMKYVKDDRKLVGIEEYKDIPEEFYYGLRLAEQPKEVNRGNDFKDTKTLKEYVINLIRKAKQI